MRGQWLHFHAPGAGAGRFANAQVVGEFHAGDVVCTLFRNSIEKHLEGIAALFRYVMLYRGQIHAGEAREGKVVEGTDAALFGDLQPMGRKGIEHAVGNTVVDSNKGRAFGVALEAFFGERKARGVFDVEVVQLLFRGDVP